MKNLLTLHEAIVVAVLQVRIFGCHLYQLSGLFINGFFFLKEKLILVGITSKVGNTTYR